MKFHFKPFRYLPVFVAAAGVCVLVAWKDRPQPNNNQVPYQDSVPKKKQPVRDLDKELQDIDRAQKTVDEKDWKEVQQKLSDAMKQLDLQKIQLETQKALQSIDMEKVQQQLQQAQESISKIDAEKIQRDVARAMEDVSINKDQLRKQIEDATREVRDQLKSEEFKQQMEQLKNIDMKKVQAEMDRAKEEIEKAKIDMKDNLSDLEKEMKSAREGISKAREELKGYQTMIYDMEKERLLSTKSDYTIKFADGELFINGKKQSDEVTKKYSKYFNDKNITISKKNGKINIDHD
jgi:chromosome segregation ATPase